MTAWGSGTWGSGPWGGGPPGMGLALLRAVALRENAVRLYFSEAVFFSGFREPADASDPAKYSLTPDLTSTGADGETARAAAVVRADLVEGDPDEAEPGAVVELGLDRAMTAWPSRYVLSVSGVYSADLTVEILPVVVTLQGLYRALASVRLDPPVHSRDLANPPGGHPEPTALVSDDLARPLGTYLVDDSGDYAMDEGVASLRKRILRRLVTRKGGFAHLPSYGVGVLGYGKTLARAASLSTLLAEAEVQIAREPDVARVRVVPRSDRPGLVVLNVLVQPVAGPAFALDVEVPAA